MEKKKTGMWVIFLVLSFVSVLWSQQDVSTDTLNSGSEKKGGAGGVLLSAFLPGAGQIYNSQFVKGGTVLAFEAVTGAVAYHWWQQAKEQQRRYKELRDSASLYRVLGSDERLDENAAERFRENKIRFSVLAQQEQFSTQESRFRSYNALAWMAGGYVYSLCDALGYSGIIEADFPRDPKVAGALAAVPGLGLGQFYNGEFSKGGLVIMTQVSLAVVAYNYHRLMQEASQQYAIMKNPGNDENLFAAEYLNSWKSRYDNAFSDRNTFLWYSLFFYLYSVVDAVVDAHLFDFPEKTRILPDLAVGKNSLNFSYSFSLGKNH